MLKDDKKKLDNQTEDKPWESQFDDDRDDRGNLSRVASKSKEKGNTYFAIILGVLLVLIIAFPIIAYTIHSSRANRPVESSKIVVNSSDSDRTSKQEAKKAKAASESAAKAASASKAKQAEAKKAASESQLAASSQKAADDAAKAASESQAQAAANAQSSSAVTAESSSSNETIGGTYTLKSGEGLYRAAVNNGLTLDQLLALNPGLTASSQVAPGTALRIK
ncbi:LysM peptidoglycan-binding domain-containing protein [Latilactobacillus graminis]|uniref:LysM domain protein n=2 Tax=Latilactobacillus graminis TaxID=60519 RepID=A0AA89I5S2_9LACO|nr:LysM domain-containing protein [Latilactobacillus graminis]KRM23787.1 lysM domain protein [Latilactobacillus graminis DSM 20719]QFP79679.1 LysM peptidoglycan-binding domain-containing protein [Latilactobacillus graminis]